MQCRGSSQASISRPATEPSKRPASCEALQRCQGVRGEPVCSRADGRVNDSRRPLCGR